MFYECCKYINLNTLAPVVAEFGMSKIGGGEYQAGNPGVAAILRKNFSGEPQFFPFKAFK